MDRKTLGLGIALGYPEEAFKGLPTSVLERSADLVRRVGSGEEMAAEVAEFLRSQPRVNEWVEKLLEDRGLLPPHLRPRKVRSYKRLLGDQTVSAIRYMCVNGDDYTWYQAFASDIVPDCRFCGKRLIRA
jgi:hypothetical protein